MHRRARQESLALQKGVHPSTVDAIASVLRLLKRKAVDPLYDCLADGSFNWEPEAVVDEGRSVAQKPRGGAAAARQQHSEHGPSMGHAIAPFGHQAGAVAARPMTVPVAAPSISGVQQGGLAVDLRQDAPLVQQPAVRADETPQLRALPVGAETGSGSARGMPCVLRICKLICQLQASAPTRDPALTAGTAPAGTGDADSTVAAPLKAPSAADTGTAAAAAPSAAT